MAPSRERLSLAEARRIAIAAQGLDRARPAQPAARHLAGLIDRIGLLQIDSVNVLARAHLLAAFSRLGPYDIGLIERASSRRPRRLVETWAHEASFVSSEIYHLMNWRRADPGRYVWDTVDRVGREQPEVVAGVERFVADHGPVTARQVQAAFAASHPHQRSDAWGWNWSVTKSALELLFYHGALAASGRTSQFERCYDLAERVIPPPGPGLPTDRAGQIRALTALAARAHGIGTVGCLADYFRMPMADVARAVEELVEAGELLPVTVRGWDRPVYLDVSARRPRRVAGRALLVPFDPLVFYRRRLAELFGVDFRLELYTPAHKRVYGYYLLLFLLGDQIVGRLDLKADRASGQLLVRSAFPEPPDGVALAAGRRLAAPPPKPPDDVAPALAVELADMAAWLNLDAVTIAPDARGPLIAPLASALR